MSIISLSKALTTPKISYPELSSTLKGIMRRCGIPGMSLAVLHKNQVIFAKGFGKRNKTDPYTVDTLQPVSSLTKTFTVAAIGELVAEGKLDWDTTPVSKYLSDFQLKDPSLTSQITFTDLLAQYSGLPNHSLPWHNSTLPRRELIRQLRYFDDIPPTLGTDYQYNDVAYAIAGEAAAHVAGTSYEQLVLDKVIRPLGLKNTGFTQSNMKRHSDNYALSHLASSLEAAQRGEFRIFPLNEEPYMALAAAEGVYMNVLDLARWGKAIMDLGAVDGKQVLNRMSVEETLKSRTFEWNENPEYRWKEFDPIFSYGFGWMQDTFYGQRLYAATGSDIGYGSDVTMFPELDLVIAMLTNTSVIGHFSNFLPYSIATPFFDIPGMRNNKDSAGEDKWIAVSAIPEAEESYAAYELIAGGIFSDLDDNEERTPLTFKDDLGAYVGEYTHPFWGKFEISLVEGKEEKGREGEQGDREISSSKSDQEVGQEEWKEPVLRFRYNEYTSTLEHYDHNTFIAIFDDVLFKMRVLMSFLPDVETLKELPDSKEFPRENLAIQNLPGAIRISEALFSKTRKK